MRGRLPLPPIPGQPVGGGVPDAPRNLAPPPYSPCLPPLGEGGPAGPDEGQAPATAHSRANRRGRRPRRPAEGSRPLPTDRTIDGGLRKPPGRACPAPTARRPGNGCPRKPRGRFHIPIRRAGCPHPAAAYRCRPFPGQPVGGGVPDALRRLAPTSFPGLPPAEGSRPLPTGRPIDGCQRNPPGRACPAPTARRPGNGCPRKPHRVSISPSVGRGAPTPPRPPAAANTPGGMNPSTTALAFPLGGRWPRRAG